MVMRTPTMMRRIMIAMMRMTTMMIRRRMRIEQCCIKEKVIAGQNYLLSH